MWLVRLACLVLLVFALAPEVSAQAQAPAATSQERTTDFYAQLDSTLAAAEILVASENAGTDDLDTMREKLLVLRGHAATELQAAQASLDDANARVKALGPPPPDGVTEPEELATHRAQLAQAVADAQVPLLRSQDAAGRIDGLIKKLDHKVWAKVSADLRTLGPSPMLPGNWRESGVTLQHKLGESAAALTQTYSDPEVQRILRTKLLRNLALFALGLGVTFGLRLRLNAWVERALARATSPRAIAWLVAWRNVIRLLVPVTGAWLLFAALDPAFLRDGAPVSLVTVPPFVLVIIAAGWLANSLFSPGLPAYRLIPVDDAQAARGSRNARLLGWVVAANLFIANHLGFWELTATVIAVLNFPLVLLGGYGLWQVSSVQRGIRERIAAAEESLPPEQRHSGLGQNLLLFIERLVWLVALGAPLLAAIGYFAASQALLYPMILSLGLFGANLVAFDLLMKTGLSLRVARHGSAAAADTGLGPVIVVVLLALASAPLLALFWGARPSDISGVWLLLRQGGTLGGIHISIGTLLSFVLVFALCFGITRVAQSVLLNSVLPRTRMDAGGKNAVLAGVGYIGFGIAVLVSISATGIDLSNIAIVAGALSVGIGFGLQNIVSNFVSGIILLVERPVKEGDWIEVGTYTGHVRRISVRSTEIETFERATVILPNSDLVSGIVLNRTHTGMSGRIQIPVSVTYDADPRRVASLLLEIAEGHPLVLEDPAPRVLLINLGPDSIDFEIRCYLRDVNFSLSARSDINFEVVERLGEAGIRQWFWQRDVRQPPPVADPVPDPVAQSVAAAHPVPLAKQS